MAIRSVGGNDDGDSAAADQIRQRARSAVDRAGERQAQAARGVGEAAAVELSSVARERLRSGAVEQPAEPVPPPTRAPSPPPRPESEPEAETRRRIESRRKQQGATAIQNGEAATRSRNSDFRQQVATTRDEAQVDQARQQAQEPRT